MLKKFFARSGSGGQLLVLYGLLLPIIFLFAGAVFDFGWWYFNLSKLQNAADAAVIAGAYKLIETDANMKKYEVVNFTNDNNDSFKKFISDKNVVIKTLQTNGLAEAQQYTDFNAADDLSTVHIEKTEDILYTDKAIKYEDAYYQVTLSGTVDHLFGFMQNQFGAMSLKAVAFAKLTQGVNLLSQLQTIRKGDKEKDILPKIIWDWERDKKDRGSDKYARMRTVRSVNRSIDWKDGNLYRTETINLAGTGESGDGMEVTGDSHVRVNMSKLETKNVNGTKESKYVVDDLFIDFRPDLNYSGTFKEDWDIGNGELSGLKYKFQNRTTTFTSGANGEAETEESYKSQFDLRILATINFDKAYKVRATVDSNGKPIKDIQGEDLLETDPLYIRIESEPIYNDGTTNGHSSVRQIIININPDPDDPDRGYNTKVRDEIYADENGKERNNYLYRPLVIFYDGPVKLPGSTSTVRDSKPVIINLNADFRGIIVMENSPVVINGNGHKFYGFVIAKEFVKTVDALDEDDYQQITMSDKTFYVDKDKFKTEAQLTAELASDKVLLFDTDSENLLLVSKSKVSTRRNFDDYDTETYIRPKTKDGNQGGKRAFISRTTTIADDDSDHNTWYEFKKRSAPENTDTTYRVENKTVAGIENFLLCKDGWRVALDSGGKFIGKINDVTNGIEKTYIPIVYDNTTYYIDRNDSYCYMKYDMNPGQEDVNSVYVDNRGEIAYQKDKNGNYQKIEPTRKNTNTLVGDHSLKAGDQKIFYNDDDFNITKSVYDTFGGVVPKRNVYQYLDDGSDDNFFTTERAAWLT